METDAEQQGRHMLSQAQKMEAALAKSRDDSAAVEKLQVQAALQSVLLLPDPSPQVFDMRAFQNQLSRTCQPPPSKTGHPTSAVSVVRFLFIHASLVLVLALRLTARRDVRVLASTYMCGRFTRTRIVCFP